MDVWGSRDADELDSILGNIRHPGLGIAAIASVF
jgi:hypothetical protein